MCPHRKEKESGNIFKFYFTKLLHIPQSSSTQKCKICLNVKFLTWQTSPREG